MPLALGVVHQRLALKLARQIADAFEGGECEVFVAPFDAQVRLFGSRVDDRRRGGDIALHVEAPPEQASFHNEIELEVQLQKALGERRIDLVVHARVVHAQGTPLGAMDCIVQRFGLTLFKGLAILEQEDVAHLSRWDLADRMEKRVPYRADLAPGRCHARTPQPSSGCRRTP